ncbi:MAG: beta-ketoacyl-[acyl-carrier-protein] synthase family protein [Lentisphaeria bacterium]|nr:beta-ketoacyl-[acyl-carrier-protein] synthase family protein [Lentisphaeria bacterium]
MHRVAITGVGVVSCLGLDLDTIADRLRRGESAVRIDPERVKLGFRSPLTTSPPPIDYSAYLERKPRKTMTESSRQAYVAVRHALADASLDPEEVANDRTGLVFGSDSSCKAAIEQVDLLREHGTTGVISSGHVFRALTSNVTMNLNVLLKTQGASWSLGSACSSGGHAIGQAADLIRLGRQDRVLCGGAQEINWESMCSFDALEAFATGNDDPGAACRPFDRDRNGLVPGGGAAALVLERYDLAVARGARICGEVLGYGFSSDGERISIPSEDGIRRAMEGALADGELTVGAIDFVCAHATGTQAGDGAEARNIRTLFGDAHRPAVCSLKGAVGHELWMAGASQVAYCAIMARKGFTAPSVNFATPDEHSAGLNILTEALPRPPRTVLCNAAGFGGTNSCLAIRFGE